MAPYAYAIKIDYNKKELTTTSAHLIPDGVLNIEKLKKFVGDNDFYFETDESDFGSRLLLTIIYKRLETDEEYAKRIESEEAYMAEYRKRKEANIEFNKNRKNK